ASRECPRPNYPASVVAYRGQQSYDSFEIDVFARQLRGNRASPPIGDRPHPSRRPLPSRGDRFLRLRRTIGNHGFARLLQMAAIDRRADEYEQEADRVAERVMDSPEHEGACGAPQKRVVGGSQADGRIAPRNVDSVLAEAGEPLESTARAF